MPDASRQSGGSSFSRFFIAGLGFVFLLMNLVLLRQNLLLNRSGVPGQAKVTATHLTRRRGGNAYNADYSFTVNGKTYDGSGEVKPTTYYNLRPGDPIAIRYVPSNPSVSESAEMTHNGTGLFLVGFLGLPTSLFVLVSAFRKEKWVQKKPAELSSTSQIDPGVAIAMPMTIRGMAFASYRVSDLSRARRFYEDVLGLKPVYPARPDWIEYHLWDCCFALTTGDLGTIGFEVPDVDAWVKELRDKNTKILKEPFSTAVCRMAVIEDPDGNRITLHRKGNA